MHIRRSIYRPDPHRRACALAGADVPNCSKQRVSPTTVAPTAVGAFKYFEKGHSDQITCNKYRHKAHHHHGEKKKTEPSVGGGCDTMPNDLAPAEKQAVLGNSASLLSRLLMPHTGRAKSHSRPRKWRQNTVAVQCWSVLPGHALVHQRAVSVPLDVNGRALV
jgi:hypothetical protein